MFREFFFEKKLNLCQEIKFLRHTHGGENLTTLLVKYFNDLLGDQSSERSRDEVTFFYVGVVLCIHLGSKYADFQEKIFADISGEKFFS